MNPTEALFCAHASAAIYGTPQDPGGVQGSQAALAPYGFTNFEFVTLHTVFQDVCAFVASSPDYNLLVFRGTKVPQDWMTDLACTPARFDWIFTAAPALGEIHAGFGHCLSDGLKEIVRILSARDQTKRLLVTGHSLGGALAALAPVCFSVMNTNIRPVGAIYTFGQPRIGLHGFCTTYSQMLANRLVRFVNKQDLVPRVPLRGWDYADEGLMIHFDSQGVPAVESMEWRGFLARTLQSLGDFWSIVSHIGVDVGDHSMAGYLALIEQNQSQLDGLLP